MGRFLKASELGRRDQSHVLRSPAVDDHGFRGRDGLIADGCEIRARVTVGRLSGHGCSRTGKLYPPGGVIEGPRPEHLDSIPGVIMMLS